MKFSVYIEKMIITYGKKLEEIMLESKKVMKN